MGLLVVWLQVQLAQIYKTCITKEEDGYKFLQINVPAVQLQQRVKDCWVFAIAIAYHAARGENLSNIKFQQKKMQQHLMHCFKTKRVEPFPHTTLVKNHTYTVYTDRIVLWLWHAGGVWWHDPMCMTNGSIWAVYTVPNTFSWLAPYL